MKSPRQQKILIIDEISYTRIGIEYALSNIGYKVISTKNCSEAIQRISSELPDLILVSFRFNDSCSIDTIKKLKEYFRLRLDIAHGAEPPIVAIITSRDTNLFRDLQYLGISTILFKPINIQQLPEIISSIISKEHKPITQERKKILIFDGEIRSHQFIESVLANDNYDFETCETEMEAMAKIRNRKYDLAILDISSFENDVNNVFDHIKEKAPDMPIITISAYGGQFSADNYDKFNIKKHFTKPININELQTTVDELMNINMYKQLIKGDLTDESAVDELIDGLTDRVDSKELNVSNEK